MKKKNKLSAHEKKLLAMTSSCSTLLSSQRSAIRRAGLSGATAKQVWATQRETWRRYKALETKGVPSWVTAARFLSHKTWQHMRCPAAAGKVVDSKQLMRLAYDLCLWGHARKRSCGYGNLWHAGIHESDNGKGGWDRVVWRHANYICVLSPDRKKLYYKLPHEDPKIATVFRGYFLCNGKRCFAGQEKHPSPGRLDSFRITCERLRRSGLPAKIVRQTPDMISEGSGEGLREGGKIMCVVDAGDGSFYHAYVGQSADSVRRAIGDRIDVNVRRAKRMIEEKEELELMKRVWVTEEDSLKAGNCFAGTRLFMVSIRKALGVTCEIGAVRADWLLSQRNDQYTKAACFKAKERMEVR